MAELRGLTADPAEPVLHPGCDAAALLPAGFLADRLARLAGVIFFCIFNRDYFMFGLFDLMFLVPEAILLYLAVSVSGNAAATIREPHPARGL